MGDDGTEGGTLDAIGAAAEAALAFPLGPIEQVWDYVVGNDQPGDDSLSGYAASGIQSAQATAQSILPTTGTVWAYVFALIVILVLVAFISREVAG